MASAYPYVVAPSKVALLFTKIGQIGIRQSSRTKH